MLISIARVEEYTFTGGGGWLDQMGIRLTQLSTGLKLKLKLSLAKSAHPKKMFRPEKMESKKLESQSIVVKRKFRSEKIWP